VVDVLVLNSFIQKLPWEIKIDVLLIKKLVPRTSGYENSDEAVFCVFLYKEHQYNEHCDRE